MYVISSIFLFVIETDLLLRIKDISHFLMQDIAFLSGKQTFLYIVQIHDLISS